MSLTSVPVFSRLVANRPRPALCVPVKADATVLPERCANCGDISSATRRETHARRSLLIPYCARCAADAARLDTTQFAAILASVVLVVTLLLTAPRLFVDLSLPSYALMVGLGAVLPFTLLGAFRPTAREKQTSSGRAAFFDSRGQLVCFNEGWAKDLARGLDEKPAAKAVREPRVAPWMLGVAVIGTAITPSLHSFNYPSLIVLNFGDGPTELFVDDRHVGSVEATSLESQEAGTRLRLAAGTHTVEARSLEGKLLQRTDVRLQGGALHLLKVLGREYCFWLEEDSYGQSAEKRRYQSLSAGRDFWVIPARIDSWFAANPSTAEDGRSSGGTMTALRHAPCEEAPEEVGARTTSAPR